MPSKSINKWQFGDFQTPDDLATEVVRILKQNHRIEPDTVIEPSCGKGAFIRASLAEFSHSNILGFDINGEYIEQAKSSIYDYPNFENATVRELDFFSADWNSILAEQNGYVLVIGNPPWVTSSELSTLNSKNIPLKSNFQRRRGIEAITGSGNFDISEWMLLQYVKWLSKRKGAIAVLCKYSVARKVIRQISGNPKKHFSSYIYLIDAKAHFGACVEACLFVLCSDVTDNRNVDCEVYSELTSMSPAYTIGERNGFILSNSYVYERWRHLIGKELRYIWRSGIKHDCSKVMELEQNADNLKNGFGHEYSLEKDYLYPLLKGSDVGNGRVQSHRKLVLVTQKVVGEDTSNIREIAPQTWRYLEEHKSYLDKRQSSIYHNKPSYSVFGVGVYTFKPWKIAISGLYRGLNFQLVGLLEGKPTVFDDTVNFLSFDTEEEARFILSLLISNPALEVLDAMIFWDEKRPVTINILRRLSLKAVAKEAGKLKQYLSWATQAKVNDATGQFELGLAEKQASYKL